MASPIMENGGFVPGFNLNMNGIHGLHGMNVGPSIYQSLPRSPMSPVLSPMGHQVLSPVGQQFSAWPVGPSFGQIQQGQIIEEGPIQWDNGAMMVPVYQEQAQVLVPIYQEPAPKFLNRAPTLKHRSPSPPKERAAPPSPRERAAPAPEIEERVVVKIIEVEKLVQVPVEKIVIKEVVKEVPVDREKIVIKEVYMEREPQVITKEVIKQVPVEVIKEVPVMVEKIVYRDRPERAEPPPPPPPPPRMTGLGMRLEREVGGNRGPAVTVVDAIIPGYAAHWSGQVVVGDILESVDGTEVEGWSLDAIKELTVGLEGTLCRLRLRRTVGGSPTGLEAVLTRIVPDAMREGTQQLEAADAYRAVASGLRNSFSSVDGKRSSVDGKRASWR